MNRRWLVTRAELTWAVCCTAFAAFRVIAAPRFFGSTMAVGAAAAALLVMVVATLWTYRLSRSQ